MKSLTTIADAANATKADVFNIQDAYESGRGRRPPDNRSGVLHPSAVGMCKRKAFHECVGHPNLEPASSKLQGIFDLGHSIHDLIQTKFVPYLQHSDPDLIVEFVSEASPGPDDLLLKEIGLGGHTDGVITLRHRKRPGWEQRGTLEIKSIGVSGMKSLTKPHKNHLLQSHLYAFRWDTPIIWVWYFGKDQGTNSVFPYIYDPDIFQEAFDYFEDVSNHVASGVPPAREVNTFACRECLFRSVCKPPGVYTSSPHRQRNHSNMAAKLAGKGTK